MKKILTFITNGKNFLLLRNNFKDDKHGGDFWFTVTGEAENNEDLVSAVRREVKEETDLRVRKIFSLNWGSRYNSNNKECEEYNYLSFVDESNIILNEEHCDYKWVPLSKFIDQIFWLADKSVLKKVLEKGVKEKLFFNQLVIE